MLGQYKASSNLTFEADTRSGYTTPFTKQLPLFYASNPFSTITFNTIRKEMEDTAIRALWSWYVFLWVILLLYCLSNVRHCLVSPSDPAPRATYHP